MRPNTADPNKKYYFFHIKGKEVIDTFLALAQEKSPVKAWLKGQEEKAENYTLEKFSKEDMRLFLTPTNMWAKFFKSNKLGQKLYFRLGAQNLLTFTTAVLEREASSGKYFICANKAVYQGQQRTNYRLLSDPQNRIVFQIKEDIFEVLDLSAGGIGILVSKAEKEYFVKDRELKDCLVLFNSKEYPITRAKIVSIWEERNTDFESTGSLEIGIQFTKISNSVEEDLCRDINIQAREAEVRKTLLNRPKKTQ